MSYEEGRLTKACLLLLTAESERWRLELTRGASKHKTKAGETRQEKMEETLRTRWNKTAFQVPVASLQPFGALTASGGLTVEPTSLTSACQKPVWQRKQRRTTQRPLYYMEQ